MFCSFTFLRCYCLLIIEKREISKLDSREKHFPTLAQPYSFTGHFNMVAYIQVRNHTEHIFRITDFFSMCPALSQFLPLESEPGGMLYDIEGLLKEHYRHDEENAKEGCIN